MLVGNGSGSRFQCMAREPGSPSMHLLLGNSICEGRRAYRAVAFLPRINVMVMEGMLRLFSLLLPLRGDSIAGAPAAPHSYWDCRMLPCFRYVLKVILLAPFFMLLLLLLLLRYLVCFLLFVKFAGPVASASFA